MSAAPFNATGTPDLYFVHDGEIELTSQDPTLGTFSNFYDLFQVFFTQTEASIKSGM